MKLMVPVAFYVKGGVERVIFSLLREFEQLIETVVVLPPKLLTEFQAQLPTSERIIYEPMTGPTLALDPPRVKLLSYGGRLGAKLKLSGVQQWCDRNIAQRELSGRLRYLAELHGCTHCLYFLSNRIQPPLELGIPLTSLSHDLFWHFAPLTYSPALVKEYDASLKQWLMATDLVFTNSHKTRQDLLQIFPGYDYKVTAIPLASDRTPAPPANTAPEPASPINSDQSARPGTATLTRFFFPSSFSLYKDHLTLLQAAVGLYPEQPNFQVILTGKETDRLVAGDLQPSQQQKTQEYGDYVARCRQVQAAAAEIWSKVLLGLGYCSEDTVEHTYATCDCVVVPSVYEGFGLAIAEAIARGLPVIAADIAVFREQMDLYDCADRVRFFPPRDAAALQQCLADFIAAPLPRLSPEVAAQRFGHWTWRQVAEGYIHALSAL
jgi:glycosyltransferase involved in cell wall biosynthesis